MSFLIKPASAPRGILARRPSQELDPPHHFLRCQQVVDQRQAALHFPGRQFSLPAVNNAGMGDSLGVEPEEVSVVGHERPSRCSGESELRSIVCADQSGLDRRGHVDPAAAQRRSPECARRGENEWDRSGWRFHLLLAQPAFNQGRMLLARCLRLSVLGLHLCADLVNMLEIVGQCRVDVGEREGRDLRNDFVGAQPLVLMPDDDVEHTHAVAGDARPAAADARRPADPISGG